jgi:hypothetical protein
MFDTFQGLPLHALVVHATVVLVPLMSLLTVLVAVRPRLREKYVWWTFVGDLAVVALVWVTERSGEDLKDRLGASPPILKHEHLGQQLIWFVIALAVTALIVALTTGKGTAASNGGTLLSAVAAVLALIWVVRIGHTGAEAVWAGLPSKKG